MSHNAKYYRKKIKSSTSHGSMRIDMMLKRANTLEPTSSFEDKQSDSNSRENSSSTTDSLEMDETVQVNNDEVEPTNTAVSMERQNLRLVRASLLLKQWILHEKIRQLAVHYGRPLEDNFKGNQTVCQPVFQQNIMEQQFLAFKHQMFLLRQRASEEELADPLFLLRTLSGDPILQRTYPSIFYLLTLAALIPSSTACVECLFSLMNSLCTPIRSTLTSKTWIAC
uniref:Uncharacterized protein LOC111116421 n=1 Tax=Crassostrea virginica TaxID=6565 RepID=A0A8B8C8K3_CRAVI|nr:uncharacterized protein LOC111116421 [Crassostrea virginica]